MEYVSLGMILGSFGIKGEARVFSYTDFPTKRFKKGQVLTIQNEDKTTTFTLEVEHARSQGKYIIVKFKQFTTPEEVNKYKNYYVLIEDFLTHKLPKNTFYVKSLIGLQVKQGNALRGVVAQVETNGKQDLIRVNGDKSILVPLVAAWIEKVDLENKVIYLKEVEGLFE